MRFAFLLPFLGHFRRLKEFEEFLFVFVHFEGRLDYFSKQLVPKRPPLFFALL